MTRPLTLRPYAPADSDACLTIWRAASESGHPFLTSKELDGDAALVRDVYLPQADITLACIGDEPVGFVALIGSFIGGLFVLPGRHRSGIGRKLVQAAARAHGPLVVEVYEANTTARGFYGALGFVQAGRRASDDRGRPYPLLRLEQPGNT